MGQCDDAEQFFHRCIESFELARDRDGVIECWSAIAAQNRALGKRKEERSAYERVLELIGDDRSTFHRPIALTMLAQLDIEEESFEEARRNLDMAEAENKTINNPVVSIVAQDLRTKLK